MTKMAVLMIHFGTALLLHLDATLPQFLSVWMGKLCAQAWAEKLLK